MDPRRVGRSIGLRANAADVLPALVARGLTPDVVTDQTSAHDALNGYVPNGLTLADAGRLRDRQPDEYIARSMTAMADHVRAMLTLRQRGAVVFDYGNNIRAQARLAGVRRRVRHPRLRARVHPAAVLRRQGTVPLGGACPAIRRTSASRTKPRSRCSRTTTRWCAGFISPASGSPSRDCRPGFCGSATASARASGCALNELVREGRLRAPIVIGRDHLDTGSVASPNRETEGMLDGSDAIADWPVLNALLNTSSGATWVSMHHGGGVGIGYSLHAGMVIVADGTADADEKLERVLSCDPGIGVIRHADAGYATAIATAEREGLRIPMREGHEC